MTVKILKPTEFGTLYNTDEIVTFDKETEKRLCDQKFAEPYKAVKTAETPAA